MPVTLWFLNAKCIGSHHQLQSDGALEDYRVEEFARWVRLQYVTSWNIILNMKFRLKLWIYTLNKYLVYFSLVTYALHLGLKK
jgi:hypothetical protein